MANDAAFRNPSFKVSKTLVKADLGTKRVCPSCAARFYDLEKRPIECPKCAFSFEPEALYKQRRTRQPEAVAETAGKPAESEEDESDDEDEEEAEEAESETIVEAVEGEAPLQVGAADDEDAEEEETAAPEVEAEEAGMQVVEGEEALEDLGTDDVDEDEDDDTLLEEVEEDEDDVSDIIDADIEKDER